MKIHAIIPTVALAVLWAIIPSGVFAAGQQAPRETIAPAFKVPIANVPGKTMTAFVVEYPPGGKTPPHRHDSAFVVGYVLSGAIRSKLDNGEERIYHAGQSWTEKPGALHAMSENASGKEPAKLLAIFIADTHEKNLVTFEK